LLQIESDIAGLGFSEAEVKANDFNAGPSKTIEGKQIYVPTALMWMQSTDEEKNQQGSNRNKAN
jgi:hypothetical protein